MTGTVCVKGIGRSCGCERCEARTSWYVDWLGNIVEEGEDEPFPGFEDDDLFTCDDDEEDEEE